VLRRFIFCLNNALMYYLPTRFREQVPVPAECTLFSPEDVDEDDEVGEDDDAADDAVDDTPK